jgi:putative colanic acid biosynthesis UDP-glucose lipid carrier transferase
MNMLRVLRRPDPFGVSEGLVAPLRDNNNRPGSQFRLTHGVINRAISVADCIVMLLFTPVLQMLLHRSHPHFGLAASLVIDGIDTACVAILMHQSGRYRFEHYYRPGRQILFCGLTSLAGCGLAIAALLAVSPASGPIGYAPAWWLAYQCTALAAVRLAALALVRTVQRRGLLRRNTVIIGSAADCFAMLEHLAKPALSDLYRPVGVLLAEGDVPLAADVMGVPICGTVNSIRQLSRSSLIDLIVVAIPWQRTEALSEVVEHCAYIAADIILPCDLGFDMPEQAKLFELGSRPSLLIASRPLKGTQALLKLLEDYVLAGFACLLLCPFLAIAALGIWLTSPGPILYRQTRTGLNNIEFTIFKFRTMRFDPHDDPTRGTQVNDPRVTWVGNLLRRTSLDELPQLLNVLRGEMSLVGPRPYAVGMLVGNEEIVETARYFTARYKIKPGLTGLAQAYGLRSHALRTPENARRSIEFDLLYVANWSLGLDLRIMLRTLLFGMAGKHVF